jgi:hypothetical protein
LQGYRLVVRGREADRQCTRAAALGKPLAKPCGLEALGRVKSALPSQIESLFTRHPALCGFSVRGAHEVPDNCPRHCEDASELFVGARRGAPGGRRAARPHLRPRAALSYMFG